MPVPEFEWKTYEVAPERAVARSRDAVAPAEAETVTVTIPDLTAWPTAADKAKILLESAAEVEHALLVQYLYAAFSLEGRELTDPAQQSAVDAWAADLHHIARQEMGHLMTAQNLLLSLGLAPNLEREDFPPQKDLYPFAMHLEPMSQRSLAKYVAAESPEDATGIDDILALATESAGAAVNHVGVIYGLLALVFSTSQDVTSGTSGSEAWDRMLRELAAAADQQQSPPEAWHLPDDAIDPQTVDLQGDSRWQRGNTVFEINDRATALVAIRAVAEEGEGSIDAAESHFSLFLAMYRGTGGHVPFPAAGEWVPAHTAPTDPRPGDIAEPRTRRWAQLADIRYGILLGCIEAHLRTTDKDDRGTLVRWAIQDMFTLAGLARTLTTLPQGAGVAGIPFTLPAPLPLPATEPERWEVLVARLTASIELIEEMQRADPADASDAVLASLLDTARERRDLIGADHPATSPAHTTSFAADILPLFRAVDIDHMNDQVAFDLTDYDTVSQSAAVISERLKRTGPRRMPPPPDEPWPADRIALFDTWVADGTPP